MSTEKIIPINSSVENFYLHYLSLWEGIVHLAPRDRRMLAYTLSQGQEITKKRRMDLREKFQYSAQDVANFIQRMLKKSLMYKNEEKKILIKAFLFVETVPKQGDQIDVTFRMKIA